jgi:hypothetical protein
VLWVEEVMVEGVPRSLTGCRGQDALVASST